MVLVVMLCSAILVDGNKPADASATDRAAYETAAAKAGNSAAAHVKLALWCETHGLSAERIKHLSAAASLDPAHVLARGLLGLVSFEGKWTKPDQVEKEIHEDPELQAVFREYLDRRVRAPQKNADAQLRLAAWCLEKGLKDEAMAHFYLVTRVDPSRDIAWVRLGYKKTHDRWVKPNDLAAQKLEADRQKRADKEWRPRLEKLRGALESTIETRRLKAQREVYQITDPRAVPMIWTTFASGSPTIQLVAVELFSQIEGPTASSGIALLALDSPSPDVRKRAAQALLERDPRDVIGRLIYMVHKPYKYKINQGTGSGSTGSLEVDGEQFDIQRFYRFPTFDPRMAPPANVLTTATAAGGLIRVYDARAGHPAMTVFDHYNATARPEPEMSTATATRQLLQSTAAVQQKLEDDVRMIQDVNTQIDQLNERVLPVLESLTGQKLGADPQAWRRWWAEQLGYVYDDRYPSAKPTLVDSVNPPDVGASVEHRHIFLFVVGGPVHVPHGACFVAGTLVQTLTGPRKIESVAVGDRVLSQQTSTGALSFQPVLATHLNGPSATLRITQDGETIVATGIHRFWKAGKGWTMARDLKAGDRLRMLGGTTTIESIEPGPTQMVYNLTVAENRDYLVGTAGLLVHDFSFVLPVSDPFDRLTSPAQAARK